MDTAKDLFDQGLADAASAWDQLKDAASDAFIKDTMGLGDLINDMEQAVSDFFTAARNWMQPRRDPLVLDLINADNKLEALHSTLVARENDTDQAFINTLSIQFDAALATELWTYDGNAFNGYTFQGGHQNDRLIGGQFRDWLDGKEGDDYIDAGLGACVNDPVLGANFVRGGLGSDYLLGGADSDFISGNDYDKWAIWDRAHPQLTAGYLDESVESKDYINGGGGNDRLSGDEGDDCMWRLAA